MNWRDFLMEPLIRGVDVDGEDFLQKHREILAKKPMMLSVVRDLYDLCVTLDDRFFAGSGPRVEIGAGASMFKTFHPEVIATDIVPSPHLDMVVDALEMPFSDRSVRAIYAINSFHHLPDPDQFFHELERVLEPGGGCVLIDPFDGPFARFVYPRLFDTEGYDLDQPTWTPPDGELGVMRGANQALTHVVFVRDRALLEAHHPGLEVIGVRPIRNYPRYLLSGGVNFRQVVPTILTTPLRRLERALGPLARIFALHQVIVLRKGPRAP